MSVIQLTAEPEINSKERQPLVAAAGSGPVTASLVIPTLNEAENLAHAPAVPDVVDELVIVDDGSTVSADG